MKKLITVFATLLFTLSSNATLMSINLDKTEYAVGDVATANIVISDVEQEFGFQKLLATFELDLMFDTAAVGYQSTVFGNMLDVDPGFPSDRVDDATSLAGTLALSEISYAFSTDLFFAQDGLTEFTLATVSFNVLASGDTDLSLANILLGDDFGGSFNQVSSSPTILRVANPVGVPEGPSLLLFGLGLCLFIQRKFISK